MTHLSRTYKVLQAASSPLQAHHLLHARAHTHTLLGFTVDLSSPSPLPPTPCRASQRFTHLHAAYTQIHRPSNMDIQTIPELRFSCGDTQRCLHRPSRAYASLKPPGRRKQPSGLGTYLPAHDHHTPRHTGRQAHNKRIFYTAGSPLPSISTYTCVQTPVSLTIMCICVYMSHHTPCHTQAPQSYDHTFMESFRQLHYSHDFCPHSVP